MRCLAFQAARLYVQLLSLRTCDIEYLVDSAWINFARYIQAVLLNCVGMDDGRLKGRYTADAGQISRRIIHGISMRYLYIV